MQDAQEYVNQYIIDSSPDCIKVLDLDGKLLSINKGGQRAMEIDDVSLCLHADWLDFWNGPAQHVAFHVPGDEVEGEHQ